MLYFKDNAGHHLRTMHYFYRAMHVVYPSVCLSVTLMDSDYIGWNSSKKIPHLVSVGCSLSADPNIVYVLQGEQPEIWAQTDLPLPRWFERRRHSIANCDRMVTDIATVTMEICRKPPSLFRMVPSMTIYDLPSPKTGVPHAPNIREWPYLRNGWSDTLHVWF